MNVSKTEVLLFRNNHKTINHNVGLLLNGKLLPFSNSVKYLGIHIDCFLTWQHHSDYLALKLRNVNGIISKLRYYVPPTTLFCIYNSLFDSHLRYACQIWAQNINNNTSRIFKLQKRCLKLLTFSNFNSPSSPLFLQLKILKLCDLVKLLNVILILQVLNGLTPSKIINTYNLSYYPENHFTRGRSMNLLARSQCRTLRYGINSIVYQSILQWNELQSLYPRLDLTLISKSNLISIYKSFLFSKYSV